MGDDKGGVIAQPFGTASSQMKEDSVMKQVLHHPTARRCCLVALTGMVLSAAVFLGEGQTRTLTTPPPIQSVKIQGTHSPAIAAKTCSVEKQGESQSTNLTRHPEMVAQGMDNDDKSHKKRLGLAIIFLGVLAEKS
jgi:hypothetical protein